MERDYNFLRELLLKIEDAENGFPYPRTMGEDGKKLGHLRLLYDEGYICEEKPDVYRLTSKGHDYIEKICDGGIWNKTKDAVAKMGGQVTFEIVKGKAIELSQQLMR